MVRIRLTRFGRRNRAFFRIGAFDSRSARDGKCLEYLGTYDPLEPDDEKKVKLNRERVIWWLEHGAQPTEAVERILKYHGIYTTK